MAAPTEKHLSALRRLWDIAQGHSGQCKTVARFLLGLYNGNRFPFDLTDFRTLDVSIFLDCITVLTMDYTPSEEVHVVLGVPGAKFERLAADWCITDREAA